MPIHSYFLYHLAESLKYSSCVPATQRIFQENEMQIFYDQDIISTFDDLIKACTTTGRI